MKKTFFFTAVIVLCVACNSGPKTDKAAVTDKLEVAQADGDIYPINHSSLVTWQGSKPTATHTGTFTLKEGSFLVNDHQLTGGNFIIDITSLNNLDLASDPENKKKLEGHLKSPDFFDAAIYPTAKFEITKVTPITPEEARDAILKDATHMVQGNFTLKDSTKSIHFPALVTIDDKTATATAEFNIDRSQWGLNYKGPNHPQDWFISKEVHIKLAISAAKK